MDMHVSMRADRRLARRVEHSDGQDKDQPDRNQGRVEVCKNMHVEEVCSDATRGQDGGKLIV